MKTRNLLIAALLLGGMTAFNSCSEKEIDNIAPPVDQPVAAELETVLTLNTAPGDNVETRAWDDASGTEELQSKERIRNYVWAIFECDAEGNFSPSSLVKAIVGQKVSPDLSIGEDKMYNLAPAKFKMTEGRKIAIVVLANCDELFGEAQLGAGEDGKLLSDIKNYGDFETYCNKFTMGYITNNAFGGYPMSSNVLLLEGVQAGAFNAAGFTDEREAEDIFYNNMNLLANDVNLEVSNQKPIPLYRMWSQVELTKISVKKYNETDKKAEFKLKEVFLMNVPNLSKAINGEKAFSISQNNWFKWGESLCFDKIEDYVNFTMKVNKGDQRQGFSSGWADDEKDVVKTLQKARTEIVTNNTSYLQYLNRSLANTNGYSVEGDPKWLSDGIINADDKTSVVFGKALIANEPYNADQQNRPINYFNFVVPESNYGLPENIVKDSPIMGQSILLVVKGDYISTNSMGLTTTTEDSYYTVVVNDSADRTYLANVPSHANEVKRNVKYDIELTVAGPGSPTPDPTLSTYLTPKVTIVPFGSVRQEAEKD